MCQGLHLPRHSFPSYEMGIINTSLGFKRIKHISNDYSKALKGKREVSISESN